MSNTIYVIEFRVTNAPDLHTHARLRDHIRALAQSGQRVLQTIAPFNKVRVIAHSHDFYLGHQDIICDMGLVPFRESEFAKTTG